MKPIAWKAVVATNVLFVTVSAVILVTLPKASTYSGVSAINLEKFTTYVENTDRVLNSQDIMIRRCLLFTTSLAVANLVGLIWGRAEGK